MTTKTETYTIPELSMRLRLGVSPVITKEDDKVLGCRESDAIWKANVLEGADWLEIQNGNLVAVNEADHTYYNTILSINDKFPTDECEFECQEDNCRQRNDEPFCGIHSRSIHIRVPKLATVKGIKLTERCECGHEQDNHEPFRDSPCFFETGSSPSRGMVCMCKQYKPVQIVEITYKED